MNGVYSDVVYRVRDAAGCLLYVGCTNSLRVRLQVHRQSAAWWPAAASLAIEEHPDPQTARAAEKAAIKTERPIFNRHNSDRGWRGPDVTAFIADATRTTAVPA